MLGVLVLVVVMAVYAGLERDVKSRLLGFTPHVLLSHQALGLPGGPLENWDAVARRATELPHVLSATAHVSDNVILDVGSWQRPVLFHGIDTADSAQIDGIARMLDLEDHPRSSADMGIDDRVVISSTVASQYAIGVGDTIRLYSTRNFEEVMKVYKASENPPVRERFADEWKDLTEALSSGWENAGGRPAFPVESLQSIYATLDAIRVSDIRSPEEELIEAILIAMEEGERDETGRSYLFTPEARTTIEENIALLEASDAEKMDNAIFKQLKSIVLPKEAEVVGVYKSSQMAVTPDVFVPLPLAQDLAGLGNAVQGIALRLTDADLSDAVAADARRHFGPDWAVSTWGDQYRAFFSLINQQRAMMYFALSFIVLVSAFSMMAVMFTVTIQKRREIGVMKALGASPSQIVRVFLYQGMILGVFGSVLGVALGRLVIHFRGNIQSALRVVGFDPFSPSFTGFGILPAHNNPVEQVSFAVMGFVLCSLSALVPAFFAARSDAAKSLRNL